MIGNQFGRYSVQTCESESRSRSREREREKNISGLLNLIEIDLKMKRGGG